MIYQIFQIIFPVFFISLVGFIYAKREKVSMEIPNQINLDIFLPIMIFYYLSEKMPSIKEVGILTLGGIVVVFGSGLLLYPLVKALKIDPKIFLPTAMFNNAINLGLPLALFAFGEEAISLAISLAIVQITGQFTVGVVCYGGQLHPLDLLKNPVIIATILGLGFNFFDIHAPQLLLQALKIMSGVAIPLILLSLGVRLTFFELKYWKIAVLGAVLCPLSGILMAFVAIWLFNYQGLYASLILLFGSLPPAILNAILAEKYNKEPLLVASIVAFGNIFSIFYIPIVLYFVL